MRSDEGDDENRRAASRCASCLLEEEGHETAVVGNVAGAKRAFAAGQFDLVVTDLKLPDGTGLDVLKLVKEASPDVPVVMITAFATVKTAVRGDEAGRVRLRDRSRSTTTDSRRWWPTRLEAARPETGERAAARRGRRTRYGLTAIVGASPQMAKVREMVRLAATSEAAVMVLGETGTGKELVARAIHFLGARAARPFVAVNCGALPENLVESELFGHKKGSFTGAVSRPGRPVRPGRYRHHLPRRGDRDEARPAGQAPAGDRSARSAAGRQHRDAQGRRADHQRDQPRPAAMRARRRVPRGPLLPAERLCPADSRRCASTGRTSPSWSPRILARRGYGPEAVSTEALALLAEHDFPGNVRELQNVIESGLILSGGKPIRPEHIADRLAPRPESLKPRSFPKAGFRWRRSRTGTSSRAEARPAATSRQAARLLGISRATLLYRMKKHGLE